MSATTPKAEVRTTITRRYTYDPAVDAITDYVWNKEAIYVTVVTVSRTGDQLLAQVEGVGIKADGRPSKRERRGRSYYSPATAPDWIAALMRQMPTAKVTLIPPKGKGA